MLLSPGSLRISPGKRGTRFDPLSLNPILAFEASRSMMAPLASESLDLDPANPSSLDIITATRAGTATYTDASGNIQTASPNTVRVDHVQGEELTPTKYQRVGYTDFSSGWSSSNTSEVSGGGYLGQPSITVTSTGGYGRFTDTVAVASGESMTLSLTVRRISGTGAVKLRHGGVDGSSTAISGLTSDWSTHSVTVTGIGGNVTFGIELITSGDSVEIAMPQVEEGTTASDFVENTTGSPKLIAAATYAPRVPMMLIEPAATNLVTNTDFSGWAQASSTTLTDGSGYAGQPSKIFTASAGTHRTFHTPTFATTAGTTYTGSIWIRRVSGTGTIQLNHQYSAQGNLTAITDDISEEWTRVEVDFTGHASSGDMWFGVWINVQGDSVEIAMPQVEEGTVATSFIPTSGSTVTRAADDLVIDGSDFTNLYNQSEGTFYVEAVLNSDSDGGQNWILGSQSSSARFLYHHSSGNALRTYDGTTSLATSPTTKGEIFRAALSFDATSQSVTFNGETTINGNHNGNYGSVPTALFIGSQNNSNHANVRIKRVIYWPHHSDNL